MKINNINRTNSFSAVLHEPSKWEIEEYKRRAEQSKIAYQKERKLAELPESKFEQLPDSVKLFKKCRPEVHDETLNYAISEMEKSPDKNKPLIKNLIKVLAINTLKLHSLEQKYQRLADDYSIDHARF